MKKSIIALVLTLSISVAFTSLAYSNTEKCKELSNRALSYAANYRDEGISLDSLTTSLEAVSEISGTSEGEKIASEQIALLVFTRFRDLSPEQTQKQFYRDCVTANR